MDALLRQRLTVEPSLVGEKGAYDFYFGPKYGNESYVLLVKKNLDAKVVLHYFEGNRTNIEAVRKLRSRRKDSGSGKLLLGRSFVKKGFGGGAMPEAVITDGGNLKGNLFHPRDTSFWKLKFKKNGVEQKLILLNVHTSTKGNISVRLAIWVGIRRSLLGSMAR